MARTSPGAGLVRLPTRDHGLLIGAALVVGAGAGLAAVGFRWLIEHATLLLSGHVDPSGVSGRLVHPHLSWAGHWYLLGVPVVGGLLYGPLLNRFAPEAKGHGVPEVMLAVAQRGGRIPGRVAVVKALASALCIGSGGSVGREGPIVQIGSALGSRVGQSLRLPDRRLRTLVACGAAGGIAATFNAPVAGVFFALELLLGSFDADAFGLVVLSSVVAAVVGRGFLGDHAFLDLPPFAVHHVDEYLLYALLGLLAGAAGVLFTKVLYLVEDGCDAVWRGPEWARPAVGGVVLGALLLVLPQMYGVGYPVLQDGVAGRYAVGFLLVLLVGKVLATSLTIGIGGSGGVFAPSLFVGAMLGSAFGQVAHALVPGTVTASGPYALIGMAAVFAGSARAPITAVLILFELTGEYTIILPLMLAVVVATGTSAVLSAETVYTLKLRRRGIDVGARDLVPGTSELLVGAVCGPPPAVLRLDGDLREAGRLLLQHGSPLPVLDAHGRLAGVVTAAAVAQSLSETPDDGLEDLLERPEEVRRTTRLPDALKQMLDDGADAVPVQEEGALVGWLTCREVLLFAGAPAPRTPVPR